MADVLTGMPDVDDLIRQLVGQDDEDDDADGITELVEIVPTRLDGVDVPASGIGTLMAKRAAGGRRLATRIIKSVPEKRITLHVAYPVNRADVGVAADGARDFAGASALEDGAHAFMKAGAKIGLFHKAGTEGAGTCVESWIHRGAPWTVTAPTGRQETVQPGDWCVGIQWTPASWELVKQGRIGGVSMQGAARRRKPSADVLAGVRKAAKMPRCGKCTAKAKHADAQFCTKCGARLNVAKSAAVLKAAERESLAKAVAAEAVTVAERAGRERQRFRSGDRSAYGRLTAEVGQDTALAVLSGHAEPLDAGIAVAKARLIGDGAALTGKCRTCKGSGRLRHPETGVLSRQCPSCGGSGRWTPDGDQADMTEHDASLVSRYTARARSGGPGAADGMAKLGQMVGLEVAAKLVGGSPVSPGEFRRAYLAAGRAGLSAAPGQEPRIPDADHVARAEDFRRGVLTVRQERPAPGSPASVVLAGYLA